MLTNKRVVDIRANVEAGLSGLENLQSKTHDQNFHKAISDNRSQFKEIEMIFDKAGWLKVSELMLGMANRRLDNLQRAFSAYSSGVMFIH